MKHPTLVERLEKYLKKNPEIWFPRGELARLSESANYLGETCGRRLREMCEEGLIDSRENKKGYVEYKWHKKEILRNSFEIVDGHAVERKQLTLV